MAMVFAGGRAVAASLIATRKTRRMVRSWRDRVHVSANGLHKATHTRQYLFLKATENEEHYVN